MKKWKCTVCGYIHTGEEPPEKCPVCKADRSKFVEMTEQEDRPDAAVSRTPQAGATEEKTASAPPTSAIQRIQDIIVKHHLHPITVHIPNGVVPVSVLFLVLAVLFGFLDSTLLSRAAYLNLIVVLLSMPAVIFTGLSEWKRKYNGGLSTPFVIKIACACAATLLLLVILAWLIIVPEVAASNAKWIFLLVNFVLLGVVAVAGHIGGKLVFKD